MRIYRAYIIRVKNLVKSSPKVRHWLYARAVSARGALRSPVGRNIFPRSFLVLQLHNAQSVKMPVDDLSQRLQDVRRCRSKRHYGMAILNFIRRFTKTQVDLCFVSGNLFQSREPPDLASHDFFTFLWWPTRTSESQHRSHHQSSACFRVATWSFLGWREIHKGTWHTPRLTPQITPPLRKPEIAIWKLPWWSMPYIKPA